MMMKELFGVTIGHFETSDLFSAFKGTEGLLHTLICTIPLTLFLVKFSVLSAAACCLLDVCRPSQLFFFQSPIDTYILQ